MLCAIRNSDQQKVIGSLIEKNSSESYYCEACLNPVIHHRSASRLKTGHFKHKGGFAECPNTTGESEYHLQTKMDIYNHIVESWKNKVEIVEVEKWLVNNTLRADVFVKTKKGTEIAIEVQATILTVDEINRRTEQYYENGIYVLWVLPYDDDRFSEWVSKYNHEINRYEKYKTENCSNRVRLKEMEIFLFQAYYGSIVCWDLSHEFSNSFIYVKFEDYKSEDTEFYSSDGEYQSFEGKTAKCTKKVSVVYFDIPLGNFRPNSCQSYITKDKRYRIPNRKVLLYKPEI